MRESAAVKTIEQCSEAKPAMPAMASAPAGSASTSSRASGEALLQRRHPGVGQVASSSGRTKTGPSEGTR